MGSAGAPLPDSLVVRVLDQSGRAVAGPRVVFDLADAGSGGRVSPDTVVTDSRGLAAALWTLGSSAGAQTVDARVVGEPLVARFTASAGASGATRMLAVSGDEQSAAVGTALPESLVVRVLDQFDNPVAGVAVSWSASSGEVSPSSASTGPDGQAATRRVLGSSAGTQSAEASVPGLDGSPVTFTHTATPGTAASLVLISGSDQTGSPGEELPEPLVVRLVDEAGNGIPDRAVSWIVATGDGSVSPSTSTTDGDGLASARWTLGPTSGTNTLNAVVSGVGVVQFTANGSGGGGGGGGGGTGPSASRSRVSAEPTSIQAVTGISTITVTVLDGSGSPVAGAAVSLSASGSGNTVTQPGGPTGPDGVVTGSLRSTVPGTKVVTATVNGSIQVSQTAQVTVTLAPASRVELLEGDDQSAPTGTQVPVRPAVRVTNDLGEPVAGFGVTFVVTEGGGSVSGASQTTNSDGIARVGGWTLGPSPGLNVLEARAGSLAGSPVVFEATATAAAPSEPDRFVFLLQPRDVEEDEQFSVTVAIVDAAGDVVPISGIEIEIGLLDERGRVRNQDLDGDRTQDTVDGIATFPGLSVDDEDDYRLRASSRELRDLPPALSDSFNVEN